MQKKLESKKLRKANDFLTIGERGFQILTPFYCYRNEKGENCPILVDRGWVEEFQVRNYLHQATHVGPTMINAVLYKGNTDNKYRYTVQ